VLMRGKGGHGQVFELLLMQVAEEVKSTVFPPEEAATRVLTQAEKIDTEAAKLVSDVAWKRKTSVMALLGAFSRFEDPSACARASLEQSRQIIGNMVSMVELLDAGLEMHEDGSKPDLKKLLREANIRFVKDKHAGKNVSEGVVNVLQAGFPEYVRPEKRLELSEFRGVFRFLPEMQNGKLDALRDGTFIARLADVEQSLEEEEVRRKQRTEEEEARRKRLAAEERKLAEEEEARHKELAALEKRLAEEEKARRLAAVQPFFQLRDAAKASVLPITIPFLDAVKKTLVARGVLTLPCHITAATITALAQSLELEDAVHSVARDIGSSELQDLTSLSLQLYVPSESVGAVEANASGRARRDFIFAFANGLARGVWGGHLPDKSAFLFLGSRGTGKSTIMQSLMLSAAVLSRGLPEDQRTVSTPFGTAPNHRFMYIARPYQIPEECPSNLRGVSMIGMGMRAACEMQGALEPLESLAGPGECEQAIKSSGWLHVYKRGPILLVVDELNDFYLEQTAQTFGMCSSLEVKGGGFFALTGSSHRLYTMMFRPTVLSSDPTYEHREKFKDIRSLNNSKIQQVSPLLPFSSSEDLVDYLKFLGEGRMHPDMVPAFREWNKPEAGEGALQRLVAQAIQLGSTHRGISASAFESHTAIEAKDIPASEKTDRRAAVSMSLRDVFVRVQSSMPREMLEVLAQMGEHFLRNQGITITPDGCSDEELAQKTAERMAGTITTDGFRKWENWFSLSRFRFGGGRPKESASVVETLIPHARALAEDGQLLVKDLVTSSEGVEIKVSNWTMAALCELLAQKYAMSAEEIDALLRPRRDNANRAEALLAESVMAFGAGRFLQLCKPLVPSSAVGDFELMQTPLSITEPFQDPEAVVTWIVQTRRDSTGKAMTGKGSKEHVLSPDASLSQAGILFRASKDFGGEDLFGVFKDPKVPKRVHLVQLQLKLNVEKGKGIEPLKGVEKKILQRFHAGQGAELSEASATWVQIVRDQLVPDMKELVIWCVGVSTKQMDTPDSMISDIATGQSKGLGCDRTEDGVSVRYMWCMADQSVMAKVWSPRIRAWAQRECLSQFLPSYDV
jgi:hypothetical protein